MRTTPLSTHSLLELIDLFEQSNQSIPDTEGQRLHGIPGWALSRMTALSSDDIKAWTQCVGYAGGYPAACGDETVMVDLEEDDRGRYRYRCPETFRRKYLEADVTAVRAVNAPKMLHYIADLLGVPKALRKGIDAPAIDAVLWQLGRMRVADIQVETWLVRGLAPQAERVFTQFQQTSLPDRGLILTTGHSLPAIVPPPRDYRIIPVREVLVEHTASPHIDVDLIHRVLLASPGAKLEKSLPVRFEQYSNTLIIATKSDKPWSIKGPRQVAAVRYLFEQFSNGRRWVPAGEILTAVYGAQKTGRSQRMQNLFSGNTIWEDYIANDGDGQYGFNLD
ncbi:hypothetical protein DF122_21220 [Burkholderia pseudomallei]|uniref:hypothetical protein n=1 Tax=Burkholderia pseudomallei TaxID=28450 RepID=UPI000F4D453D|nr:hypothetical protein [Burkholderia pseudomallei]RPE15470.1 hypothetical protein DF127_23350 [Burkholderia pseudomallei]RPE20091.1 hypothetical protein DF068_21050 [Burkholderia pseudomallei]RQS89277.1 hypothetical protein DF125_22040 [Burkholderia pseudomallei]RQZ48847.1 hypothetical protein DF060_24480 [Burkholderia pseudomallei]RSK62237.1 hypothetical protein DF122_21220 [Burkholderia pseudomallei]